MTLKEYKSFYIDYIETILKPAVYREAHIDSNLGSNQVLQSQLQQYSYGLMVLALVSIIEANFLGQRTLKDLRNFRVPSSLSPAINPVHLSCFIYLRDCFAHNPDRVLFSSGNNTEGFKNAIANKSFPFATIEDEKVLIGGKAAHALHLIILRFFGEDV